MKPPRLYQIDLIARDIEASIAFYRALGVEIPEAGIWRTATGIHHVDVPMPDGLVLHFDSPALAKVYDRGWREPTGTGTHSVLSFRVASRDEVDRIQGELARLGYRVAQPPYDAFWGSRYAIVEDPDGNHVGIMSPQDPARLTAPPDL